MEPSALNWVRDELDKLFVGVQDALRRYSDDPSCQECLEEARARVAQIRGTLVMVQVRGAVLICDEMLQALDLLASEGDANPGVSEALLRAALQLPDYLEHGDDAELASPMLLVPLLNELRAARGATLQMDVATLMPELREVDDGAVGSGAEGLSPPERLEALQRARRGFQRDLLELLRGDDPQAPAARLRAVSREVETVVPAGDMRRLFWVAGALFESLTEGALEPSDDIRRLAGRLDRELGRYLAALTRHVEDGTATGEPEHDSPGDLIKTLLFHLARVEAGGEQTRAVREVFGLDDFQAGDEGGGVGRAVYETLRQALEDDLAEVRERLDVLMRAASRDDTDLGALREQVERIGSTLSLLGLEEGQRHTDALAECLLPDRGGKDQDQCDMELAQHLLALESLLESGLRRQTTSSPQADFDGALAAAVYKESLVDVRRVRDMLLEFLADDAASGTLDEARATLARVEGAMAMGGFEALRALLNPLLRYLETRSGQTASTLAEGEIEALAEVLSSIEVALESSGQPWRELGTVHERGVAALQRLGTISGGGEAVPVTSVDRDVSEPAGAASGAATPDLPVSGEDPGAAEEPLAHNESGEPEEAGPPSSPEPAPAPAAHRGESLRFDDAVLAEQVRGPDVDPEILEIFLEEADEEIQSLGEQFPRWQQNPADPDSLAVIRRSFHTLKGSGRLAGALRLGEFAWAVESFLNRLLDSGSEADHATTQVVDDAIRVLPGLVEEVRNDTGPDTPVLDIALRLRALVEGGPAEPEYAESEAVVEPPPGATEELEGIARSLDAMEPAEIPAKAEGLEVADERVPARPSEGGDLEAAGGEEVPEVPEVPGTDEEVPEVAEVPGTDEEVPEVPEVPGTDEEVPEVPEVPGTDEEVPEVPEMPGTDEELVALAAEPLETAPDPEPPLEAPAFVESTDLEEALEPFVDAGEPDQARIAEDEPGSPEPSDEEAAGDTKEVPWASDPMVDADGEAPEESLLAAFETEPEEAAAEVQPAPADTEADEATPVPRTTTDPQLWQVFATEARTHLETLRQWLAESEWRPERVPNHDLERALHTLNGSARTAEVRGIYSVCGPFERLTRIHRDLERSLPARANELLASLVEYVADTVEDAEPDPAKTEVPPDWADEVYALLDHATAEQLMQAEEPEPTSAAEPDAPSAPPAEPEREAEPPPAPAPAAETAAGTEADEIDPEFAEVFIEEAHDILESAFSTLASWHAAGGRPGPDQSAFQREVHTLKGSARMAGFDVVGAIAHALESALGVETETGLEPRDGFFLLAEKALADVQALVERGVGPWQTDESASESLRALRAWAAGESESDAPASEATEEWMDTDGEVTAETAPETDALEEDAATALPGAATEPAAAPEGRRIQEQVRMDAEVLDSLVNNAGELATFHRRFEQSVGRVEGQVEELERTISRLRQQLRKLEIETEAQILFRVEQESGEELGDFDPLEMDRYSGIQQLSRALAESVGDLDSLKDEVNSELQSAGGILLQQRRVGTDLQDQLMRQRMVRFARMAPRLRRVVRQAGEDLGKDVRVNFHGQSAELDRALLERLVAPLEHLLRNAIAHGIEDADTRRKRNKPESGQIEVSLEQSGSEIRLQVTDDGGGIDANAVRERAIERGLIAADSAITDPQALQLILQSGFSTATEVSHVAGRGVGLDVVNSDVKQLGGTLEIDSTPGQGSRFVMRLPFTLAITQALLVNVGDETFAVPMASVEGVVRARADEIDHSGPEPSYSYIGQDYTVRGMGDLMGIESQAGVAAFPDHPFPLLLVRADDQRVALRIDSLVGSQEVVVKSVGPVLSRIPGVAGATLLGDGTVMLILDLSMLVRFATMAGMVEGGAAAEGESAPRIMVVDDSITIRKVTARLLVRHGYDVVTARDGLDAVALLDDRRPDLILLDVEMPRMDGFEFAAHVRDHPDLHRVPIIMITSRSGSKHRERADRLGVNGYLGKPYLENDLLEEIRRQLEGVPA